MDRVEILTRPGLEGDVRVGVQQAFSRLSVMNKDQMPLWVTVFSIAGVPAIG